MIIGADREKVIENIREALKNSDFYAKAEIGDPVLTNEESVALVEKYLASKNKTGFKLKSFCAKVIADLAASIINKDTEFVGSIDEEVLKNGFIVTSNHFGPLENTIIRYYLKKHGKVKLNIVSQVTNFAMKGFIGFLMNYTSTVPLPTDPRLLAHGFTDTLRECIDKKQAVLIYPEQEMWFNYRKPRPPKKGAYHFAAKIGCPVVSCFVEIIDKDEKENESFYKTKYRMHILDVLYPDTDSSVKKNSEALCAKDYELKKAMYEKCYNKPLTYDFSADDIAGWIGKTDEEPC